MKSLIKQLLRESLNKESLTDFYNRFKQTNPNPNFLDNNFKNPNFDLRLTDEGGVKSYNFNHGEYNKCEKNTFLFIKNMVSKNDHRFFPVSGWAFMESTTYFEHFWVYDAVNDMFLDVTPMHGNLPYAYGGVVNYNINDNILNANNVFDVPFLKGKHGSSLYSDCEINISKPKLNKYQQSNNNSEERLFNYINTSSKYSDLNQFIKDNGINSLSELKSKINVLNKKLETVRNNREFDLYTKIINQIEALI
jgi:hypothetical protein